MTFNHPEFGGEPPIEPWAQDLVEGVLEAGRRWHKRLVLTTGVWCGSMLVLGAVEIAADPVGAVVHAAQGIASGQSL